MTMALHSLDSNSLWLLYTALGGGLLILILFLLNSIISRRVERKTQNNSEQTRLMNLALDMGGFMVTEYDPKRDTFKNLRGHLMDEKITFEQAVATLHDAIEHAPDKAYVYFRIAEIFRTINNPVTANIYYHKALQEDPYYAEAWHALSLSYSMTRSYTSAIECAQKALKIDMESPLYMTTLALIYADSGDLAKADQMFECAQPYFTDFEEGWLAYADYLIMQQKYEMAIDVLTRGLPDCEMVLEFNKRLALCYLHCGMRNMLFNAVRACIYDSAEGENELLEYCPELGYDIDVMNIILSHRHETENYIENKQ